MLHTGAFVYFELSSILKEVDVKIRYLIYFAAEIICIKEVTVLLSLHMHFQGRKISDVRVIMMVQLANKAMGDAYGVSVEELLHSNLQSVQKRVDKPQEEQMLREEEKDASWSNEVRKAGEQMAAKGEEVRRGDGVRLLGVEREVMESGEGSDEGDPVALGPPIFAACSLEEWDGQLIHCKLMY